MKTKISLMVGSLVLLVAFHAPAGLFGPSGKDAEQKREFVRKQSEEMLANLYRAKPALKERLAKSAGYATFRQSDVNLLLLASGFGFGRVVDNKTGKETFMRVGTLGGGVGLGVKDLRIVFVFNDPKVMKSFVEQGYQFGGKADVAAKYKDTGVSADQNLKANVDFKDGTVTGGSSSDVRAGTKGSDATGLSYAVGGSLEIYQFTESGVSLQATVTGTKYWKDSKLNE